MPDKMVLILVGILMEEKLGEVDDLPHELGNTIANVYVREISTGLGDEVCRQISLSDNNRDALEQILTDFGLDDDSQENDITLVNRMIRSFREIRETEKPRQAGYIAQIILDTMKYGIKDATGKSEMRRWFERRKKRGAVQEIPGLMGMIPQRKD